MGSPALCAQCGAPVAILVLEPSRCRHCGGAPHLPAEVASRLAHLRQRISRSASKAQQLDAELRGFGDGAGLFEIGMGAILWGFLGGLMIGGAAANLPEHQSFFGVLVDPPIEPEPDFATAVFWMTWVTVVGFATCCLMASITRLVARRQVRFAYPAPPAFAGGPPGCRICGADLPKGGAVRRCRHCGADHVVDGVHFQNVADDVEARLRAREEAVERSLAARQAMVRRLEKLVLGPPFGLILLAPLVFFLGQPHPIWWLVPVALAWFTGGFFLIAALLPHARASAA